LFDVFVQYLQSSVSPDTTRPDEHKPVRIESKPVEPEADESMDFDIDDIDKQLELALDKKRVRVLKKRLK